MNQRKGRFSIKRKHVINHEWFVTRIMGLCSIVRAECLIMHDVVEYEAISNLFDEVKEGEIIPTYQINVHQNGKISAIKR